MVVCLLAPETRLHTCHLQSDCIHVTNNRATESWQVLLSPPNHRVCQHSQMLAGIMCVLRADDAQQYQHGAVPLTLMIIMLIRAIFHY